MIGWHDGLDLDSETAAEFARLAEVVGCTPAEVIRRMIGRLVEADRDGNAAGLREHLHRRWEMSEGYAFLWQS